MKLYFVRHGKAVDAALYDVDFERPLTDKGARRVRRMSQWLARMGVHPTAIFASPRVRAQQTAQIMAEALERPVTTRDEVNFEFSLPLLEALIQPYSIDDALVFVGHNPSMSEVVRSVTGCNLNMEVGAVACAQVSPFRLEEGELVWYMTWHCLKAIED